MARRTVGLDDLSRALEALRGLTRDPNRTDLVGAFIGSLTGPSAADLFERVWDDPVGREILEEGRDLRRTLSDREALASLPPGSLGRAYHEWTAARDFTAEGIADAIRAQVPRDLNSPEATMAARVVDMHDLWHVLNGWDSDIHGELHLLGYSYAQLGAYAWLALGLLGNLSLVLGGRFESVGYVRNAIARGRRAGLLVAVDWEAMLPLPIEEVRRRVGVDEPVPYQRLTWNDLERIRRESPVYRLLARVLPA